MEGLCNCRFGLFQELTCMGNVALCYSVKSLISFLCFLHFLSVMLVKEAFCLLSGSQLHLPLHASAVCLFPIAIKDPKINQMLQCYQLDRKAAGFFFNHRNSIKGEIQLLLKLYSFYPTSLFSFVLLRYFRSHISMI